MLPALDDRYRTSKLRILYGFSSGTVPVDTLLFSNSPLFSLYISAGWGLSDAGYERLAALLETTPLSGQRVYLSTEGTTRRRKNVVRFLSHLDDQHPDELQWKGHIYEDLDHGDVMTRGLFDGLDFLFEDWAIPSELASQGLDGLAEHEAKLGQVLSDDVALQSEALAGAAFELLHTGEREHAGAVLSLFDEAVRRKPWGAEMLAYRAYALWQYDQKDRARIALRKAIDTATRDSDPRLPEYENVLSQWDEVLPE